MAYIIGLGKSISFGRLSLAAKVLWAMLLTSCDDQGRGLADADVVKWHVCPNVSEITVESIPALLDEMVAQDMLLLYEDTRERALYQVINWWVYQRKRFARESLYEPPVGWVDRVRLQRGRETTELNWNHPGGFSEPYRNGNYGQYGGQYGEQYGSQCGGPDRNETKRNETTPPLPPQQTDVPTSDTDTDQMGGGGGVNSLSEWLAIYESNIGPVKPKARACIERLYRDPAVSLALWDEAVTIAVENNKLTLAYIMGIIRRRTTQSSPDPPAAQQQIGQPQKFSGVLPQPGGQNARPP